MEWGFLWIMVALKVPLALLLWLVWWAIRQEPEQDGQSDGGGGGGSKVRHPRGPLPHTPRRGPHGDPAPPAPARVRTTVVRARSRER
jgi:hypothetical protein